MSSPVAPFRPGSDARPVAGPMLTSRVLTGIVLTGVGLTTGTLPAFAEAGPNGRAAQAFQVAATASAEGVDRTLEKALQESAKLKAEEARRDGTKAGVDAAVAAFLPTVSFTTDWALRGAVGYSAPQPGNTPTPSTIGVTVSQPIFDGFRRYNDLKRARAAETAGTYALADARQQVLLDAAAAHLAVIRDTAIVALRSRSLAHYAEIAKSTRARFDGGDATKTDIDQSESRRELAVAELERARGDLAASRAEYAKLAGNAPHGTLVRAGVPDRALPRSEEELVELARSSNPRIGAADSNAVAARFAAKAAVGEFLPAVDLQVARERIYGYSATIDRQDSFAVKLQVRVPIYSPSTMPKVREARALAMQRHYEAVDTRDGVVASARTAFSRHRAAQARAAALSRQTALARRALEGVSKELLGGQRSVLDLLNAQEEVTNAEIGRVSAEYERDYTAYVILATIGRLDDRITVAGN